MNAIEATPSTAQPDTWHGFTPGLWQRDINVRWSIQRIMPIGAALVGIGALLFGIVGAMILTCLLKETGPALRGLST